MAYRTLDLTLISAKDLNNVNIFSKMDVYAAATIAGDPRTQQRTPVDHNAGKNPSWNATLRFPVPSDPAAAAQIVVDVVIRSERMLGDRDIGEVHIPLKELLEGHKDGSKFVSYQVRKPHSGKAKGVLNLSYKFADLPETAAPPAENQIKISNTYPPPAGEKPQIGNEPVMAYPAAGASGSAYPPPYAPAGGYPPYAPQGGYPAYGQYPPAGAQPGGYGYGAPPPQGYGYGAPPPGYGYGGPPAGYGGGAGYPPKNNSSNFGLGLGAGLLGGAIGGMLIGDMISDDGGFGDGF